MPSGDGAPCPDLDLYGGGGCGVKPRMGLGGDLKRSPPQDFLDCTGGGGGQESASHPLRQDVSASSSRVEERLYDRTEHIILNTKLP